ncbi:MAG TPA: twin-arginine translocase TatA/TatE family subunit [Solirubrobacteraceae bacterium]|nr:twin-arginine translocase TatA/TatE family subunit [Solirubrobacteraceae bacterium]
MGIESPVHLLFIAIVALIVLGPKRLPGLARALGQGIREFRSSLDVGAEPAEPADQPPAQPQQAPPPTAPPAQPQQSPPPAAPPVATTSASPVAEVAERTSGQSNGAERPRGSA